MTVLWTAAQMLIGGGSVWLDGVGFGGGAKAKSVWRYHRSVRLFNDVVVDGFTRQYPRAESLATLYISYFLSRHIRAGHGQDSS